MKIASVVLFTVLALVICLSACTQNAANPSLQQQKANTAMIKKELAHHNDDVLTIFSKHNKTGKMKGVIKNTITVDAKGKVTKCVIQSTEGNLSAALIKELMQYYSAVIFPTRNLLSYTWMVALE